MRSLPALAAVGLLVALAPAARAGTPIAKAPTCAGDVAHLTPQTIPQFRRSMLCLINATRKAEHLPALARNAKLEGVAQSQSNGLGGHGKSLADIGKRFEKKGYKPAAYNEAFSFIDFPTLPTPYGFLARSMASKTPCSEILDPRFRDVGIGATSVLGGATTTLALEFGLKQGARQPSSDTSKSASCPHKLPARKIQQPPITVGGAVFPQGNDTLLIPLTCNLPGACVLSSLKVTLPDAGLTKTLDGPITVRKPVAYGGTPAIPVQVGADALQKEVSARTPTVSITFTASQPSGFSDAYGLPLAGTPAF
jgi:uncharacterized protein YkwD